MTLKGKVRPEVDGHEHPVYGVLKAGAELDVQLVPCRDPETGKDAFYFPCEVFDPVGWAPPAGKDDKPNWYLPEGFTGNPLTPAPLPQGEGTGTKKGGA